MSLSITSSKERFFKEVLDDAMKHVLPKGGSQLRRSYTGLEGYELAGIGHEVSALLLLSCIDGLPNDIDGSILEEFALKTFLKMKISGRPDCTGFLDLLWNEILEHKASESKSYHCMFFLQLSQFPEWLRDRTIMGYRIKPAPKVAVRVAKPHLQTICQQSNTSEAEIMSMVAVETRVVSKNPHLAIDVAYRVSGILRGSHHAARGATWYMAGTKHPSNDFAPSPIYLVRQGQNHVAWGYSPGATSSKVKIELLCPPKMTLLLDLLQRNPERNTPLEALRDALICFATSGDDTQTHHEFLGLWQALETLSMAEGGDTNKVAANIGNLWKNGSSTIRYQLLAIAPIRNSLVHSGSYDTERQSATFLLTSILRDSLIQFAQLCQKMKTKQHFIEMFSMMTLSPKALRTKSEAIRVVKWMREI